MKEIGGKKGGEGGEICREKYTHTQHKDFFNFKNNKKLDFSSESYMTKCKKFYARG